MGRMMDGSGLWTKSMLVAGVAVVLAGCGGPEVFDLGSGPERASHAAEDRVIYEADASTMVTDTGVNCESAQGDVSLSSFAHSRHNVAGRHDYTVEALKCHYTGIGGTLRPYGEDYLDVSCTQYGPQAISTIRRPLACVESDRLEDQERIGFRQLAFVKSYSIDSYRVWGIAKGYWHEHGEYADGGELAARVETEFVNQTIPRIDEDYEFCQSLPERTWKGKTYHPTYKWRLPDGLTPDFKNIDANGYDWSQEGQWTHPDNYGNSSFWMVSACVYELEPADPSPNPSPTPTPSPEPSPTPSS